MAGGDDHVGGLESFDNFDFAIATLADLDLDANRASVAHLEHVLIVALRNDRLLGYRQRVLQIARDQADAREHSGPQRRVRIAHQRADHDRASRRIDQRIDRENFSFERLARQRIERDVKRLAHLHLLVRYHAVNRRADRRVIHIELRLLDDSGMGLHQSFGGAGAGARDHHLLRRGAGRCHLGLRLAHTALRRGHGRPGRVHSGAGGFFAGCSRVILLLRNLITGNQMLVTFQVIRGLVVIRGGLPQVGFGALHFLLRAASSFAPSSPASEAAPGLACRLRGERSRTTGGV